jgi:glycine dehydrogenase subunit 1
MASDTRAHPWMANSAPGVLEAMLAEIGAKSVAELFEQIPADHFRKAPLDLPPALSSEMELKRDLVTKLKKNADCEDNLSPSSARASGSTMCRPSWTRSSAAPSSPPTSGAATSPTTAAIRRGSSSPRQLGALLNLDVVQLPVYSWGCAIGHAIRMAARLTGRREGAGARGATPSA